VTEQLTGMDAAFLALETPELPMHVVGVLILDPAGGADFSVKRLRQVVADRLHLMPPFCRRLVDVPLSLDRPYWHYETDIDLDKHVVEEHLATGDLHALGDLVGTIASKLLDRKLPLWELHVVSGLDGRPGDGSQVALIAKVHHSTLYGAAGAEFIAQLLDLSPEGADVPPAAAGDQAPAPGRTEVLRRTAVAQVRRPLSIVRLLVSGGRGAVGTVMSVTGLVRRHGRAALPALAPRTAISGPLTESREGAFTALSLGDAKAVKEAAGVKLNDVVLAVVALALRRYLMARDGVPDRPLACGVPVNAGAGGSAGTNTLATMIVALPVEELPPGELLSAVYDATVAAKEFVDVVGMSAVAGVADVTPPAMLSMVSWLTRTFGLESMQPPLANVIVSNVMGPPLELYLAGALVQAIYPLGPLLPGVGMNLTVLSNIDRLDVGVMSCPDVVDDVWELVQLLPGALADLKAAVVAS
jgi:diacylglycerol O-acyltransferase / wax synthase